MSAGKWLPREPTREMNREAVSAMQAGYGFYGAYQAAYDAAPDADDGRVEELERENFRLNEIVQHRFHGAVVSDVAVQPIEVYEETKACIAELKRRIETLSDSLRWVLPMAKGWAHDHPVGSNAEIVAGAEAILRGDADA